jgi:hypothetical protein
MARSNFSFKKRQKELERKKKQEEKRQRRMAKKEAAEETPVDTDGEVDLLAPKMETTEDPDTSADEPAAS